MLWNASAIKGYQIAASDGDVGHVDDILIDEASWTVRWLIVHTGSWLDQRSVCLPAWSLTPPDPEAHHMTVDLTRRQIEGSPEVGEDDRLSPADQAIVAGYYAEASRAKIDAEAGGVATLARHPLLNLEASTRLFSLKALMNATVEAVDGEIGHVESLILDDRTWVVKYLMVHTGGWWADKKVLILPATVTSVDDIRGSIDLIVDREKVRGSPPYWPGDTVDVAFDEQFHIYYGIKWMRK